MTREKVLKRLCYYDLRNPDGIKDEEDIKEHNYLLEKHNGVCVCDNCFYGRTQLAEYILTLLK